jgi:hypothetical protein
MAQRVFLLVLSGASVAVAFKVLMASWGRLIPGGDSFFILQTASTASSVLGGVFG